MAGSLTLPTSSRIERLGMGTALQLFGLALLIVGAAFVSIPAAVAALGVVSVFVGLAAERD